MHIESPTIDELNGFLIKLVQRPLNVPSDPFWTIVAYLALLSAVVHFPTFTSTAMLLINFLT